MKHLIGQTPVLLSTEDLVALLEYLNAEYRSGNPMVDDQVYDQVYLKELQTRAPDHPFLNKVEPEVFIPSKGRIQHPVPMLSTAKAYTNEEVVNFLKKCQDAASKLGIDPQSIEFKLTPKLDGASGRYNHKDKTLTTRGDGTYGYDTSKLLEAGLVLKDSSKSTVGEIVLDINYFEKNLAEDFSDPRTFVTGVINSDKMNPFAVKALKNGALRFESFDTLSAILCTAESLQNDMDTIIKDVKALSPCYLLDGIVIECNNNKVKEAMGSTGHHHNWQIAKKEVGETALSNVIDVEWQVGRTGVITPVIIIEPVVVSNATVRKVTGHNLTNMFNHKIGVGAMIEITRSGEVIPKHLKTHRAGEVLYPQQCPSCDSETVHEEPSLYCRNPLCDAQKLSYIQHHFKTLQTDLFGPKAIDKIIKYGKGTLIDIYEMTVDGYIAAGFGAKQAENLKAEVDRSIKEGVRDYLLVGSLGISNLGRGAAKKILKQYSIDKISDLTADDIKAIEGFGEKTSTVVIEGLSNQRKTLDYLLKTFKDKIVHSLAPAVKEGQVGVLYGKNIVFTGSMQIGKRDEMKADAESLGATAQNSVNGKTDILVCGQKVGSKKIEAATKNNVKIMTEVEYLKMVSN